MPDTETLAAPPPPDVAAVRALLKGYAPPTGIYDEMRGPDGRIRPHYREMIAALSRMSEEERGRRFGSAEQYLREAGVFYRVYGGAEDSAPSRVWPLAHPPLILDRAEWSELEAGLIQRAHFLERLLGDLYGERRMVRDGVLPSPILGRNPEFLRPLADQGLSGQPLIRFIAVDLGRGPDGRWWVLGDRTQAPSGAGFALENRVANTRAFPDLIRKLKVERLAAFFKGFRKALYALDDGRGLRVALLTPGPHNETYFEHAYLARYLGFLLLEGGDLAAHGPSVAVRTVDGAKPIRVLWRRLDGDFADPLELYPRSRIGSPGLVRAIREGAVEMVNALGSGILETRALLAFQPALARALLGEDLKLPTVATWWCGQEAERAFVSENRDRLSLADAFPIPSGAATARRKPLDLGIVRSASERLIDALDHDGGVDVVGQEIVALSTAPMFVDGRLQPRPVTMRVFLSRDADGWRVMPGAFARVSSSPDARAISMQAGGHSVDVWILSDTEDDKPVSLLSERPAQFARRLPSAPPSRAADNLFWLGRYVERAEAATRLARIYAGRLSEVDAEGAIEACLLKTLVEIGMDEKAAHPAVGLLDFAAQAFATASRIRDRFSPDGWRVLGEIVDLIESHKPGDDPRALADLASGVLTRLAGFSGLVNENMYQFTGWRFLQCGRRVERGQTTAVVAAALTKPNLTEGGLEALLEYTDSRVTYRRRYSVDLSRSTVVDLAVLDPLNPRSVAYQANAFDALLRELPGLRHGETLDEVARRSARLRVRLATGDPEEATIPFLTRIAGDFGDISNLMSERYFSFGPQLGVERLEAE
ncbi:hypothetical protein GCM10008171_01170 [Methylopila jiangsuensis]|uniref:DUF403 domain-containing protein n=1 Tax=Methylopila jiangsuensis TaxID=586230 RepID=A0A9W6JC55_9HYPH|nr:circularly permuted type 2 ATP-grasp protein [Methylopila jiangsuensis]MDR6287175.1 putative circularly permuted ATP-grasp superfamily protein [Methylopila jiangsuensis]GLK74865.1 hypothetical protein GCM10008171_01170 [Methylopila jiangsuensis]